MVETYSEIDRLNLAKVCNKYPTKAIVFDNTFFGGTEKKPFGLVPNNWDGETLYFYYEKSSQTAQESRPEMGLTVLPVTGEKLAP